MAKKTPKIAEVHSVTGTLNMVELSKAGSALTLEIFGSGGKLGKIVIGRGSISWYGKKRKKGFWWNWTDFAKLLDGETYDK